MRSSTKKRFTTLLGAAAAVGLGVGLRHAIRRARRIELAGKVVVVTGGSRGLGLLLAEEFGAAGARVAICGRDPAAVEVARDHLVGRGIETHALSCDVGDAAMAEAFITDVFERFGRVDVVVNNAGVIRVGAVQNLTAKDVEDVVRTNLSGPVQITFAALPHLRIQGRDARIVNVTSIGGRVGVPHMLGYAASKFGLVGFSETLRSELDGLPDGPRVVTVTPGLMRTGSYENAEFSVDERDARAEFDWFAIASSLPLLSIDARVAARRIVRATLDGRPLLRLGLAAHLGDLAHRASPALTSIVAGAVARVLARTTRQSVPLRARRGREIDSPVRDHPLLHAGGEAGAAYNEAPRPPSGGAASRR